MLATFTDNELDGLAAAFRKPVGKGSIVVLGTMLTKNIFSKLLLACGDKAGTAPATAEHIAPGMTMTATIAAARRIIRESMVSTPSIWRTG